jgi:hypothetical protein
MRNAVSDVSEERLFLRDPHGAISQKTAFFPSRRIPTFLIIDSKYLNESIF